MPMVLAGMSEPVGSKPSRRAAPVFRLWVEWTVMARGSFTSLQVTVLRCGSRRSSELGHMNLWFEPRAYYASSVSVSGGDRASFGMEEILCPLEGTGTLSWFQGSRGARSIAAPLLSATRANIGPARFTCDGH